MIRNLILCILYVSCWQALSSQSITVLNKDTFEPVEYAQVIGTVSQHITLTDVLGVATLAEFQPTEDLLIKALGFEDYTISNDALIGGQTIYMVQNGIELNQVVISANKWRQSSRTSISKIASISQKQIDEQSPQTTADLLEKSGEVYIQKSQQSGGSPSIRGFSANRLLYTVDGVRMNSAIFRSGNLQNVISLDPFSIEHAEVLFGPGSVMYGSDAIGGVMSFQSLIPQFNDNSTLHGSAVLRYSSANNEKTGHLDLKYSGKRFASYTSGSYFDFGNLRMGNHGPANYLRNNYATSSNGRDTIVRNPNPLLQIPTEYSQYNVVQKFAFQLNDDQFLDFGLHVSRSSDNPRYDRLLQERNGQLRYAEWYYGPQIWTMANLNFQNNRATKIYDQFKLIGAYQRFGESRISRTFNSTVRSQRTEKVDAYSLNFDLRKSIPKGELYYGVESVLNVVNSNGFSQDIATSDQMDINSRYPNSDWVSNGLYTNVEWNLSNKLSVVTGARLNHFYIDADFSEQSDLLPFESAELHHVSLVGNLGFIVNATDRLSIKWNLSNGFRSPNIDDIGKIFDSEPGAVIVPNPDLKSEKALNTDIGISLVLQDHWRIGFTAFYTRLYDAITRDVGQLNGQDSIIYDGVLSQVYTLVNANRANVYGVNASVEYRPSNDWKLYSVLNWQKGREYLADGTEQVLRHASPLFGMTELTYQKENIGKFRMQFEYNGEISNSQMPLSELNKAYLYAVDEDGLSYAPSWATFNMAYLRSFGNAIDLNVQFNNIFDKRYKTFSSGIASAGRHVSCTLSVDF